MQLVVTTKITDYLFALVNLGEYQISCPSSVFLSFQPDGLYSEQNTWKSPDCSERPRIFLRVEYAQNDTQNIDPDSIRNAPI